MPAMSQLAAHALARGLYSGHPLFWVMCIQTHSVDGQDPKLTLQLHNHVQHPHATLMSAGHERRATCSYHPAYKLASWMLSWRYRGGACPTKP
jgi:hypothetical protein